MRFGKRVPLARSTLTSMWGSRKGCARSSLVADSASSRYSTSQSLAVNFVNLDITVYALWTVAEDSVENASSGRPFEACVFWKRVPLARSSLTSIWGSRKEGARSSLVADSASSGYSPSRSLSVDLVNVDITVHAYLNRGGI